MSIFLYINFLCYDFAKFTILIVYFIDFLWLLKVHLWTDRFISSFLTFMPSICCFSCLIALARAFSTMMNRTSLPSPLRVIIFVIKTRIRLSKKTHPNQRCENSQITQMRKEQVQNHWPMPSSPLLWPQICSGAFVNDERSSHHLHVNEPFKSWIHLCSIFC